MVLGRYLILLLTVFIAGAFQPELDAVVPCTLTVNHPLGETVEWQLLIPVPFHYGNIQPGTTMVDTLLYAVFPHAGLSDAVTLIPGENGVPEVGTFYLGWGLSPGDTLRLVNPPHRTLENTIQISLRPDDSYIGYLYELFNTPFLMAPRRTPDGSHQSDSRLGTDCAGLAVYGKRRQGGLMGYFGPGGITEYLLPLETEPYRPVFDGETWVYRNTGNSAAAVGGGGLQPGDILHFGEQVSVFLEDRGVPGVLDSGDLLIQCWFTGPHVCTMEDNGFFGSKVRLYRWAF